MGCFWNRMYLFLAIFSATTSVEVHADMAVYEKVHSEIYSRNSVVIDKPAAVVWPFILDTNSWKQGMVLRHVDGEKDALGGVYAVFVSTDESEPQFYAINVEFVPEAIRTIRIVSPQDGAIMGYSSWILEEASGITKLSYHVYMSIPLPPELIEDMSAEQIAAAKAKHQSENHQRYRDELSNLKMAVEQN